MSPRQARILRRLSSLLRVLLRARLFRTRRDPSSNPRKAQPTGLARTSDPADSSKTQDLFKFATELDHDCSTQNEQRDVLSCRMHNEGQLVLQLPNELLCQIFMKGALPRHAATYPPCLRKVCDTKRYIGQVCHRWRQVALECPHMWCNTVDLSAGILWVEEVLRRTRDRPISVFMPQGTEKKSFLALDAHKEKIRGFFGNVQHPHLARYVLSQVGDWRRLEEMDLVTCSLSPSCLKESFEGSSCYSSNASPLSNLRCLFLSGHSIPLPTRPMPTLTCLFVAHSSGAKTTTEWLNALRNFPNLEELSLVHVVKPDLFRTSAPEAEDAAFLLPSGVTQLSRLRELELRGNHSPCSALFRGLVLPPSCVLRLATHDSVPGPSLDAVTGFLGSHQPAAPVPFSHSNRSLFFKASGSQIYLQVAEQEVIKLDIHLKFTADDEYRRELDSVALTARDLLSATITRFEGQGGFSTLTISLAKTLAKKPKFNEWLDIISKPLLMIKGIQTLRLQETTTASEFLKLIMPREEAFPPCDEGSLAVRGDRTALWPYPQAQQIILTNVHLNREDYLSIREDLVAFILDRPGIKSVRLFECKHAKVVAEQIRASGARVDIDFE